MKAKIIEFIFTDKKKDGDALINKAGTPFFMLHLKVHLIELENKEIFISKFYSIDKGDELKGKIKVGEEYNIEFKQSGIYYNIINIRDKDNNIII